MRKTIASGIILAALITPALAEEFWVVQSPSTKKCTIVQQKPTTTTEVVIGNSSFKTRADAETSMKTTKVCTTQ